MHLNLYLYGVVEGTRSETRRLNLTCPRLSFVPPATLHWRGNGHKGQRVEPKTPTDSDPHETAQTPLGRRKSRISGLFGVFLDLVNLPVRPVSVNLLVRLKHVYTVKEDWKFDICNILWDLLKLLSIFGSYCDRWIVKMDSRWVKLNRLRVKSNDLSISVSWNLRREKKKKEK